MKYVIPPAFSKMRQDMLCRKLKYLINDTPHMEQRSVSENHSSKKPIDKVDQEVMIHVVQYVEMIQCTVIIVSVKTLRNRLSKTWMNVAKKLSGVLSVLVKHEHQEVEVD